MVNEINSESSLEIQQAECCSISRWTKLISIIYYINSIIFFAASFIPFFVKRTEGFDPHFVSGAISGSIQILIFAVSIFLGVLSLILGYYLLNFSRSIKISDGFEHNTALSSAFLYLKRYFALLGAITIVSYLICIIVLMIYITG